MKVLQINVIYRSGSTGRTVSELGSFLTDQGVESFVAYGIGERPRNKNEFRIENRFEYLISNFLSKLFGDEGNHSYFPTKRLLRWLNRIKPDIIHLRNLHEHYINLPLLHKYLSQHPEIKVVISLHDFWFFTGKCPLIRCEKWKKECFKCPALSDYPVSWFFDCSRKMYKTKKEFLLGIPHLSIVGVSSFTERIAKQSFAKNKPISFIYNWVNLDAFKPIADARFPFQKEKPVILFVWAAIFEQSSRFQDFLELSLMMKNSADFVLVGHADFPTRNYPTILFLEKTNSLTELAFLYSSADVFFDPSTEDTFGKVVAESLACGTPAVVYNNWALPELVPNGCGAVVEPRDLKAASSALYTILCNGKAFYTNECRSFALANFDFKKNATKTLELYRSLMEENEKI
jgi:putative colanic acid biosynthesis glycosyltransferase